MPDLSLRRTCPELQSCLSIAIATLEGQTVTDITEGFVPEQRSTFVSIYATHVCRSGPNVSSYTSITNIRNTLCILLLVFILLFESVTCTLSTETGVLHTR